MLSPSMSGEITESSIASALASPDATLVADDQGRYVAANDAACRLLGYTREELLQLSVWDLTPDPHEVEGLILWKEFIEIGAQAGVYWLKRKDGSPILLKRDVVVTGDELTLNTGNDPFRVRIVSPRVAFR